LSQTKPEKKIMSTSEEDTIHSNFSLFRDCLSTALLQPDPAPNNDLKKRRRKRQHRGEGLRDDGQGPPASGSGRADPGRDAEELADFIDYLATEIFEYLPDEIKELDYRSWRDSEDLQVRFSLPLTSTSPGLITLSETLPLSVRDTLRTYSLISPDPTLDSPLPSTVEAFLSPVLSGYLVPLTTAPPASTATRTEACEICERDWINLSYHHLIPRFVHDKAVKRGWHKEEDLQNVAWLCGACHRFVHHFKTHEELARNYYTVDLLLEEEEVQKWAAWVGRLRWKSR
jgi:hypothetical protein